MVRGEECSFFDCGPVAIIWPGTFPVGQASYMRYLFRNQQITCVRNILMNYRLFVQRLHCYCEAIVLYTALTALCC